MSTKDEILSRIRENTGRRYEMPDLTLDAITYEDRVSTFADNLKAAGGEAVVLQPGEDVNAVIHTHPTYSMVYSCQGKDIPLFMDEAAQTLGDTCRTTPYALPGSRELAEGCVAALGEKANACLVRSHGAVAVGGDMDAAFRVCTVLEIAARILYMIEATGGKPDPISDENIANMQDFVKNHYGQGKD